MIATGQRHADDTVAILTEAAMPKAQSWWRSVG